MRVLPIVHIHDALKPTNDGVEFDSQILSLNKKKHTTAWLDVSPKAAEDKWHRPLSRFRVEISDARTENGRRRLTEFFHFNAEEVVILCRAYESGTFPVVPKGRRLRRKLKWTLAELRNSILASNGGYSPRQK